MCKRLKKHILQMQVKKAMLCLYQNQPSRDVLKKKFSEKMQQIYRKILMPKCDFKKVAKHIFRTPFLKNTSGRLLLSICFHYKLNIGKINQFQSTEKITEETNLANCTVFYFTKNGVIMEVGRVEI